MTEDYVSSGEATNILEKNHGRRVDPNYIYLLSEAGKVGYQVRNGREREYLKADVEKYKIGRPRGRYARKEA